MTDTDTTDGDLEPPVADETPEGVADLPHPEPDVEPGEDAATEDSPPGDDPPDASTNREAARYRRRLRDVEGERDALAGQLAALRRQVAEHHATGLARPSDLWLAGTDVSDLLDDQGAVDPAKVAAAVNTVRREHPHWGKTADLGQGARGVPAHQPGFEKAFSPPR